MTGVGGCRPCCPTERGQGSLISPPFSLHCPACIPMERTPQEASQHGSPLMPALGLAPEHRAGGQWEGASGGKARMPVSLPEPPAGLVAHQPPGRQGQMWMYCGRCRSVGSACLLPV